MCDAHEHLGSDSEVVMLEQGSDGVHGPCVTSLNNGLTGESSPEQELGAVALASRAQAASRHVGLPRRWRSKERRPSMSHAGSKPILPSLLFDQFYDLMEATNPLYRPGGYENVILRMESQELSTRKRMSEHVARSELEAMDRDARCALLNQNHQFQIAV